MVFVSIAIYRKFNKKCTIDLIFVILLLSKLLIFYNIVRDFDYD